MKVIVEFGAPADIASQGYDGKIIDFPFSVTKPGEGMLCDQSSNHVLRIRIVGTLLNRWGFERIGNQTSAIAKQLFPFAEKEVKERIGSDVLDERQEICLDSGNYSKYPFDLSKLMEPEGVRCEIEVTKKRKIGF